MIEQTIFKSVTLYKYLYIYKIKLCVSCAHSIECVFSLFSFVIFIMSVAAVIYTESVYTVWYALYTLIYWSPGGTKMRLEKTLSVDVDIVPCKTFSTYTNSSHVKSRRFSKIHKNDNKALAIFYWLIKKRWLNRKFIAIYHLYASKLNIRVVRFRHNIGSYFF